MKVNFNFDTGARRIRFYAEDPLEEVVLKEMAFLGTKGVELKICELDTKMIITTPISAPERKFGVFEIEMRINGFDKEKKSE